MKERLGRLAGAFKLEGLDFFRRAELVIGAIAALAALLLSAAFSNLFYPLLLLATAVGLVVFIELLRLKKSKDEGSKIDELRLFYAELVGFLDGEKEVDTAFRNAVDALPISKLRTGLEEYLADQEKKVKPPPLSMLKTLAEKDLINYLFAALRGRKKVDYGYVKRLGELVEEAYVEEPKIFVDFSWLVLFSDFAFFLALLMRSLGAL